MGENHYNSEFFNISDFNPSQKNSPSSTHQPLNPIHLRGSHERKPFLFSSLYPCGSAAGNPDSVSCGSVVFPGPLMLIRCPSDTSSPGKSIFPRESRSSFTAIACIQDRETILLSFSPASGIPTRYSQDWERRMYGSSQ